MFNLSPLCLFMHVAAAERGAARAFAAVLQQRSFCASLAEELRELTEAKEQYVAATAVAAAAAAVVCL